MNDYLLSTLIRQRHEKILTEVSTARRSQLNPRQRSWVRKWADTLGLFLNRWRGSINGSLPEVDESKRI